MLAAHRPRHTAADARNFGAPPGLLLSSRSRQWDGVVVELHHFRNVDVVVPVREHIVGVHLTGAVNLLQSRNGKTCVKHVRAGDVTITPHGEPKRFQHTGENVVVLLRLAPAFVQEVAGDEYALDPDRLELRENFGTPEPQLVSIGKRLLFEIGAEGPNGRMMVEALTIELVLHLLRHHGAALLPPTVPAPKLSRRKLQRAIEYIDFNLREDFSLADVAQTLAMSPGHFAHAFKQTTGLPPHRFVLQRRVERAKSLLLETDLPITEIAHRIGCASPSHFSVMFHRLTGRSPRDYRHES